MASRQKHKTIYLQTKYKVIKLLDTVGPDFVIYDFVN